MIPARPAPAGVPSSQRGIALPVILLLLVAITLPAVIMLRQSLANQSQASAARDHAAAFQAAEAGLAVAEEFALSRPEAPASGCLAGVCATPDPSLPPAWEASGFWESASVATGPSINGARVAYVVEYMGPSKGLDQDCTTGGDVSLDAACNDEAFLYRVTVHARTPTGAQALLQTAYLVP